MMGAVGMELGMRVAADERQHKQQDEESEKDEAHVTKTGIPRPETLGTDPGSIAWGLWGRKARGFSGLYQCEIASPGLLTVSSFNKSSTT
jgi:hypothetical protein